MDTKTEQIIRASLLIGERRAEVAAVAAERANVEARYKESTSTLAMAEQALAALVGAPAAAVDDDDDAADARRKYSTEDVCRYLRLIKRLGGGARVPMMVIALQAETPPPTQSQVRNALRSIQRNGYAAVIEESNGCWMVLDAGEELLSTHGGPEGAM